MNAGRITVVATFVVAFAAPLLWGAETCDPFTPHQSANSCLSNSCPPGDQNCLTCCNDVCTLCHSTPVVTSEFPFTSLNAESEFLEKNLHGDADPVQLTSADICQFCHGSHVDDDSFISNSNHPATAYPKTEKEDDLKPNPEGSLLACSSPEGCEDRCINCHYVHVDVGLVAQEVALFRMDNGKSPLCTACHLK